MTKNRLNDKAEAFFTRAQDWHDEYKALRAIILQNEDLTEDYKWMHPCYTLNGKNVVLIHGFKDYCALLFHKGVLMKDPESKLIQQTKNVQAARQLRFTSVDQIEEESEMIRAYVNEAVEIERAGKQVEMKKTEEYDMPLELQEALEADEQLKDAFYKLTPGRQRQYMYFIGQAKREATRQARVEKYKAHILEGKGMND
ncbi:YdeI/OmpD-associated family protein [Staphylococcus simulans]|uniref:YdeI/OmpD-associated family protein n=1 Tax=Staphylococcus simulans TaxID=1286 RepID=UPI00399B057E